MTKVPKSQLKAIRYKYYLKSLDSNAEDNKSKKSIQDLRKHLGLSAKNKVVKPPKKFFKVKKVKGDDFYYRYGYYKESDRDLALFMSKKGFVSVHGHHDISGEDMILYVKADNVQQAYKKIGQVRSDLDSEIHFNIGPFVG